MLGFGSNYVKRVTGEWVDQIGTCKTTNLPLSEADANLGTLPRGKLVDCNLTTHEMLFTTGFAKGLLRDSITIDGTTGLQGFKDLTIGKQDLPKKKGDAVSIIIPPIGSIWEFEGTGVVGAENLVCTSGAGKAIASNAVDVDLSCEKGTLKLAEADEYVVARLIVANLTPYTDGNRRIRIEWVGCTRKVPPA